MLEASWDGDVKELMCMLETGVTVDITRPVRYQSVCKHVPSILLQDGWHSLMYASRNGHVEVVDKLLQHGARVDLQSKVCFTFQNSSFLMYIP